MSIQNIINIIQNPTHDNKNITRPKINCNVGYCSVLSGGNFGQKIGVCKGCDKMMCIEHISKNSCVICEKNPQCPMKLLGEKCSQNMFDYDSNIACRNCKNIYCSTCSAILIRRTIEDKKKYEMYVMQILSTCLCCMFRDGKFNSDTPMPSCHNKIEPDLNMVIEELHNIQLQNSS